MRLFLLLFFSFLSIGVFAQAPAIQWAKTYGGSNIDNAKSIQPTLDGGYIVVGYSLSADGDITGNHGASDCWVAKLSNKGIIEWQRSYGGSRTDEGNYIQQTSDGGYIVAGATNSVDGDVAGWHPGTELGGITTDFWVLKLTSNGNIQWQKCYGGFLTERAYCIQQTTDGGYVVAGYANSLDGDVTGFHDSFGLSNSTDCWIIKITASGTLQWQKCYGGFYWDIATSIRQTSDGGYIVGGYENSRDGGDVKGSHNPASGALWSDYWILKLSSTGSLQWQKCLGGAEEDILYSILETTDGGYIAAGSAISNDGDVTGNHGSGQDYWIVKLNNSGGIVWQKSYGGIYADIATSIQQTADGGYIIAGGGCGGAGLPDNGDIKVNQGTTDFWLL
ncbi:MAG: hypothetical protein JWM28_2074 [Chitinophagaceae bacterium]|nr:hypothetical protein [Chitinophagaceae bacterium]